MDSGFAPSARPGMTIDGFFGNVLASLSARAAFRPAT
jgi:hypothetical protein